jgi:hypothetical protein
MTTKGSVLAWTLHFLLLIALSATSAQSETSAHLAWEPSPDSDIAGYNLYFGDLAENDVTRVLLGNVTAVEVKGLDPARTYYFYLTATSVAGIESDASNIFTWSQRDSASGEAVPVERVECSAVLGEFLWPQPGLSCHLAVDLDGLIFLDFGEFLPAWASGHNLYFGDLEMNEIYLATLRGAEARVHLEFVQGRTYFFFATILNRLGLESSPSNIILHHVTGDDHGR